MTDQLAVDFAGRLATEGVTLKVRNNRLWLLPGRAYKDISDDDRAFLRHHRAELKLIAAHGIPDVARRVPRKSEPTPEEPEPEVYVYNHRITSHDVKETLMALGDQALTDYHAGRITKREAYERAMHHTQQRLQLAGARRTMVTVQALWNVGTDFVLVPFAVISYALGDEAGAHEAIAA